MSSPPQPDPARTTATAERLAAALEAMAAELADAKKASEDRDTAIRAASEKRDRHNFRFIVFDVIVTVVLAVGGWQLTVADGHAAAASAKAASAAATASALHAAQVAGCENGNQYRAGVVASLDRLVFLLEGPHPGAAVQKAAAAYERYVLSQNEPRDCASAYPLTPGKGGTSGG